MKKMVFIILNMFFLMGSNLYGYSVFFETEFYPPSGIYETSSVNKLATGGTMGGMTVTAFFGWDDYSETRIWQGSGDNGGVYGTGWSLTLNGDSSNNVWSLTYNYTQANSNYLDRLLIDAGTGGAVFDRGWGILTPLEVTPGSGFGNTFEVNSVSVDLALYPIQNNI